MNTPERTASRGERSRSRLAPLPYLLSRGSFLAGIVVGAWTQQVWIFLLGVALGAVLALVDRVAERNATFDTEVDQVLMQIRAEDAYRRSQARPSGGETA